MKRAPNSEFAVRMAIVWAVVSVDAARPFLNVMFPVAAETVMFVSNLAPGVLR